MESSNIQSDPYAIPWTKPQEGELTNQYPNPPPTGLTDPAMSEGAMQAEGVQLIPLDNGMGYSLATKAERNRDT